MELLRHQNGRVQLENLPRPITGVVRAPPAVIRLDVVGADAALDGIFHHRAWFVVTVGTVVAANQDLSLPCHRGRG